jgi:hypothetical protein
MMKRFQLENRFHQAREIRQERKMGGFITNRRRSYFDDNGFLTLVSGLHSVYVKSAKNKIEGEGEE